MPEDDQGKKGCELKTKIEVSGEKNKTENISEQEKTQILAAEYLIELIRSVLEKRTPRPKPDKISMGQILKVAQKHNLECISYDGAVQIAGEKDAEVMQKWKRRRQICTAQSMMQQREAEILFETLTKNGVRILPLKGIVLKRIYPRPEYRQMTDIDILADEENRKKIQRIMEEQGYTPDGRENEDTVDSYVKKPWMHVEVHDHLMARRFKRKDQYQDVWKHSIREEFGYQMDWNDYYIFMMDHFAKHFYHSGSGIRFLLDIYVFLREKGNFLDQDELEKRFAVMGLKDFRGEMEQLAQIWFGNMADAQAQDREKERNILLAGTFGTKKQYYMSEQAKIQEKYKIAWLVKPVYLLKRIFPGLYYMRQRYPVLRKIPFLLPITWILRFFRGIMVRKKEIAKEIRDVSKS